MINPWYYWRNNIKGGRIYRNYYNRDSIAVFHEGEVKIYGIKKDKPKHRFMCESDPISALNSFESA